VADEDDVVVNVLGSFFAGVEDGKFKRLTDREALWQLLTTITKRKVIDLVAYENRQKRNPPGGLDILDVSDDSGSDCPLRRPAGKRALDPRPSPDLHLLVEEECRRLLDALGDASLRSVAIWKMEGYTDAEIAARLGCTMRTVERKLHLIRSIWCCERIL
jgi:DNA-directed RNA polymerase specialized sigma24 family protein